MDNNDFILYSKEINARNNKNLAKVLNIIAFKYDLTVKCQIKGKQIRIPKLKQTKLFVCEKCLEYFGISISLKQINSLLRPSRGQFPYTTVIIMETIYNLLKENQWENEWKDELEKYIEIKAMEEVKFEEFLMDHIPQLIVIE